MAKRRLGTDIRRDQIAEAALRIVYSDGIRALSVATVAKNVGIVPSAVYRHYKNKDELITTVYQRIQTHLNSLFQKIIILDTDPVEKLRLLLTQHIEMICSNSAIAGVVYSEENLGGTPEKQEQLYNIIQDLVANIATIVADGQKKGAIREDIPAENIAVSFLGMIQPATLIWNLNDGKFDLLTHSRTAWNLFSDSIRPK